MLWNFASWFQEDCYVLPLRVLGLPLRMSCPLIRQCPSNPPMVTCHPKGMVVRTEWRVPLSEIKVNCEFSNFCISTTLPLPNKLWNKGVSSDSIIPVSHNCPHFETLWTAWISDPVKMVLNHTSGIKDEPWCDSIYLKGYVWGASNVLSCIAVNGTWEPLTKASPQCVLSAVEHREGVVISVHYGFCLQEKVGCKSL